ncbi:hypothetical protein [Sanyastnella coralliicola]|uniref:hypothetical protein n=1 Tax=Sanyastnella coralliicola TaxID=3069118 RepID=UPI0027B9331A|nr:hypothetical protein [Longitalea sp. SCSIO 12813]
MQKAKLVILLLVLGLVLVQCKKDDPENPYEDIVRVQNDNPDANDLPVGNFAWLHAKVFKPTCANSGCHDGTFEPEFNTISSSYNSLVNHSVISNDAGFTFNYRVVPGSASQSLLNERLTNDIPNSSGIMPLEVDEDSDWNELSASYISAIAEWINSGAPDMFGNMPGEAGADLPPQVEGLMAFPAGNTTTPYERDEDGFGITPILVDAAPIDIWVYATDDQTAPQDLMVNEIRYAESIEEIDSALASLFSTGENVNGLNFNDAPVTFLHKATIDLTNVESGTTLFLRTYFDDGAQESVTAIPNENSNEIITSIFVIRVQ